MAVVTATAKRWTVERLELSRQRSTTFNGAADDGIEQRADDGRSLLFGRAAAMSLLPTKHRA